MQKILIKDADFLVTVDKARRIIRDGSLAIEGGRIVAVGKASDMPPRFAADETIDARGRLVLPGLFDTHIHNAQQLGRGLGDEAYSGPERLFRRLWVVEAHMDFWRRALRRAARAARAHPRGHHLLRRSRQLLPRRDRARLGRERHPRHDRADGLRHGADLDGEPAAQFLRADG